MMKKRNIIFLIVFLLGLTACQKKDKLEKESVLSFDKLSNTNLDSWITDNYVNPYNIKVSYKWRKESAFDENILYPPQEDNIKFVLQAGQELWLDLLKDYMGENFKNTLPIEIKLFGGKSERRPTYEDLSIKGVAPLEMTLFRVDEFQKDDKHVTQLIHNIYNNYIKLLIWKKPFDREAFRKLNSSPYRSDFESENSSSIYVLSGLYSGFYSPLASWNDVDEDFAETATMLLMHTEKEINSAIESAVEQRRSGGREVDFEESLQIRKTLNAKRDFVIEYLKIEYGVDLRKLNYLVLKKKQEFLK